MGLEDLKQYRLRSLQYGKKPNQNTVSRPRDTLSLQRHLLSSHSEASKAEAVHVRAYDHDHGSDYGYVDNHGGGRASMVIPNLDSAAGAGDDARVPERRKAMQKAAQTQGDAVNAVVVDEIERIEPGATMVGEAGAGSDGVADDAGSDSVAVALNDVDSAQRRIRRRRRRRIRAQPSSKRHSVP